MLSRAAAGNGVPLPRRDPVRVIVQPSNSTPNGGTYDGITDYTHDSDDDNDTARTGGGRSAAAVMWLWHQQWTRRAILIVLAIIIMIAIAKLSITSSSIASRSSSPLSTTNDALLGGPPSWRQRQHKQQQQPTPQQLQPSSSSTVKSNRARSPVYRTRPRRTHDNDTTTTIEPIAQPPAAIPAVNAPRDNIEISDDVRRAIRPSSPAGDNSDNNNSSIIIPSNHAFSSLPYGTRCVNSVQGVHHVADSSGAVCTRRSLMNNGCCNRDHTIDLLSCRGCRSELKCCDSFEYCASCCLASKASV